MSSATGEGNRRCKRKRLQTEPNDKLREQLQCAVDKANSAAIDKAQVTIEQLQGLDGAQMQVVSCKQLDRAMRQALFDLERSNMREAYDSEGGWDGHSKWKEMFHAKARYLIISRQHTDAELLQNDGAGQEVLAFSHFRFELDTDGHSPESMLYIYELQVAESARRQGLGLMLLQQLESLALEHGMHRTKLTVFKRNTGALAFYARAGYTLDSTSPGFWGREESFEIWSKIIQPH